jgi:hypothetical protein
MNKNTYQWSRPKTGGLYLIELRQRLARGKTLRQHLAVRAGEISPYKRADSLLDRIAAAQSEPLEVA